jgi:hypothetical protein
MNRPGCHCHFSLNTPSAAWSLPVLLAVLSILTLAKAAEPPRLAKIRVGGDPRGFVTADGRAFVPFGVNYYRPGTGWAPQLWKQFDAEATRQDFQRMQGLGVNCVRVFLSYGSFYSEVGQLSAEGVAKFDRFLALAEDAGVYVHPTGPDHWEGVPEWARGDRVAEERVLAALETFWRLFATRYRGRSVLFAYDLRNEPEVPWDTPPLRAKWNLWLAKRYGSIERLADTWKTTSPLPALGQIPPPEAKDAPGDPRLLDYQGFREEIADAWTERQAAAIKAADPDALVTVGLIQWSVPALLPGVAQYAAFRPSRQARFLDFLEVHFYPLAQGAYEYASDESEQRNLAYLESVVREVAQPGKPVVVAEFGWYGGGKPSFDQGRHPAASEDQQARWCRRVVETTAGLAGGWLNWGFYDHPQARDVSELTGLLTVEGKVKAWGREFRRLAGLHAGRTPLPLRLGHRPSLDWDRCMSSTAAGREFREDYLRAFMASRASEAQR